MAAREPDARLAEAPETTQKMCIEDAEPRYTIRAA